MSGGREYTSHDLPPDIRPGPSARRMFARLARQVPGARKLGAVWVVPSDAWEAFRSKGKPVASGQGFPSDAEFLAQIKRYAPARVA